MDPKRHLKIEGAYNTRDLGGYATRDGRHTRWGQLLRADSLHRLPVTSQQALLDYGLRTVLDLRKSDELQNLPNPFFGSDEVTYYHQNMVGDAGLISASNIPNSLGIAERKHRVYSFLLDRRRSKMCEILSLLALPDSLPSLFHCSAGADRTGIVAALVLGIAGVPAETIAEDYGLTPRFLLARHLDQNPEISAGDITWQEYQQEIGIVPETILAVLRDLEERHRGGVEGYVRAIGLGEAQIESIREAIVE